MCYTNINDGVFLVDGGMVLILFVVVFIFCFLLGGTFICCEKKNGSLGAKDNMQDALASGRYTRSSQSYDDELYLSIDTVDMK